MTFGASLVRMSLHVNHDIQARDFKHIAMAQKRQSLFKSKDHIGKIKQSFTLFSLFYYSPKIVHFG